MILFILLIVLAIVLSACTTPAEIRAPRVTG
jgi:starvation-inducible outer membrane lipoprotein